MSISTRHTLTVCPTCGAELDASTHLVEEKRPKEGDVSLCVYCAEILVYGEGLTLYKPDPMELLAIKLSPAWQQVKRVQTALLLARTERGKRV